MEDKEMIMPSEKLFLECTKGELEWAKTQNSMTNYYIELWADPGKNAMQLSNPMWYNGSWRDMEW